MGRLRNKSSHASTKLDISALRRIIDRQTPMAVALGVVRQFEGESSHYEIITDTDTGIIEVLVDIELQPSLEKIFCRLGFGQDQVYKIPRVGQEVAVLIPQLKNQLVADELENDPIIVAILDTDVPTELDGDDVCVIAAPRTIITSGSIQVGASNANPDAVMQSTAFLNAFHILLTAISVFSTAAVTVPPTTSGPACTTAINAFINLFSTFTTTITTIA